MKIRMIRCRGCRTSFHTEDDPALGSIACPKCGTVQGLPDVPPKPSEVAVEPDGSVFVPAAEAGRRRGRKILALGLTAVIVATVATVIAWPYLRKKPRPAVVSDPVESAAVAYLKALTTKNTEAASQLGTVDLPPAIRSFRAVRRDRARDAKVKGSFAPIAALHARIEEKYTFDTAAGRYVPRDALGPAAEVLDKLHEAKAENDRNDIAKKIASGSPDDLFDAAESLAKPLAALSETILSPRKLIPSYKQLIEDAKPPLPLNEKALALDYGERRETWDALLKRSFATLRADGPFLLERAEVTASVVDSLASAGDPPTTLRLTFTRFQLEGIDTGWRVTSARRAGAKEPAPLLPEKPRPSPGETGGSSRK
jgi:hypothetical protein